MRYARFLPVRGAGANNDTPHPEKAERTVYASPARLRSLMAIICAALAAGLLLSPKLWLTRTSPIPMTPAWEALRTLVPAHPFDLVLFGALLFALLPAALSPWGWRWFAGVALVLCAFLALADQQRWQP